MDRRQRLVAAGLPLVLLVAACSGAATPSPSTPVASVPTASQPAASQPAASQPVASEPAASASEGTAETYEVKVASGTVGSYLTGEDGKTLYTFKNDAVGSGKSTCSGGCATKWPAFTVDSKDQLKAGAGVTGALDVFARDDGSMQVSYKGAPLYYYAADTKAGDTMGQGIGGVWFVANP
jgi:predicted lipoprotein with Yx(FWY)xxD motif